MSVLNDLLSAVGGGGSSDEETSSWRTTPIAWRDRDGVYVGHNGQVWLYRMFPLVPLEWEDPATRLAVANPLDAALHEIAATSRDLGSGMAMLAKQREFHLISVAWDEPAGPPPGTPPKLDNYIDQCLDYTVPTRALFLGVRLWSSVKAKVDREATGFKSLVESLTDTVTRALGESVPDMANYAEDRQRIETILARHRARVPTRAQTKQLESWFNHGRGIDTEIYRTRDALVVDRTDRIEFAGVLGFDNEVMESPETQWALDAFTHPEGTSAISIRGQLQPNKVARSRVRRSLRKLRSQQEEEAATSDIDKPEFRQQQAQAQEVEDYILNSGEPLVTNCSILFGRRVRAGEANETFVDTLRERYGIQIKPLEWRQLDALDEMLPCSTKRLGEPFAQELFISTISYAGLQGFTNLGDPTGVYVGMGDPDWTPVYLNPLGAPLNDLPAACGVLGDSGSGKSCALSAHLPTPSGWTTMGEIQVGDQVIGRDGKPCTVTYLSPVETPEMYDVHLSDGQVIRACVDHQWVVSSYTNRARPTRPWLRNALANYDRAHRNADMLDELAEELGEARWMTTTELTDLLEERLERSRWTSALDQTLEDEGCPRETRTVPVSFGARRQATGRYETTVFDVVEVIAACRDRWSAQTAPAWKKQSARRVEVCEELLGSIGENAGSDGVTSITRMMMEAGLPSRSPVKTLARQVAAIIDDSDIPGAPGEVERSNPATEGYTTETDRVVWPAAHACRLLAARLRRRFELRPHEGYAEQVLTTKQMIREGVRWSGDQANFAIRLPEAVDLPEADLPVDPYVLGVWLGDGSRDCGQIASATAESCTDPLTGEDDQAFMIDQLREAGYPACPVPSDAERKIGTRGLMTDLRAAEVLNDKHIPVRYQRASAAQRLALLQGLMDTDGTIDENGSCELALCDALLAHDALSLIRSLGIKASMKPGEAAITEDDPDNPGHKRRRVTGMRWRICFTTTAEVFRLPRKACRVPTETRATQDWLYITDITPAPSVPARCITVDSPDHTYLVGDYVPTHNTYFLQSITTQAALAGQRVVFINPKPFDDLSPTVELLREHGVPGSVVHLSRLEAMGGFFDPFRFVAIDPRKSRQEGLRAAQEQAAEIAAQHILSVMTEFTQKQEITLAYGLKRGALQGARCVADALESVADPEVRDLVLQMARSYTQFGLGIGFEPQERLDAQAGFTLIQFDRKLDLPEDATGDQASYTTSQRIAQAALRLITTASLEMLIGGGGGVLVVDEAHHYLGSPQGRKQLQSLGREGRSQGLLPILATQRISDLIGHDLESYVSRWFCGKLTERREAEAALQLCGLDATEPRLRWLAECGPSRDEETGAIQPSMFLHKDLKNRHAAVLIGPVPDGVHQAFSTNPADRAARDDAPVDDTGAPALAEGEVDLVALFDGDDQEPTAAPDPAPSQPPTTPPQGSFPGQPEPAAEEPPATEGTAGWVSVTDDDPSMDDFVNDWRQDTGG